MLEFFAYLYLTVGAIIGLGAYYVNQEDIQNQRLPRYSNEQIFYMSVFWLPALLTFLHC